MFEHIVSTKKCFEWNGCEFCFFIDFSFSIYLHFLGTIAMNVGCFSPLCECSKFLLGPGKKPLGCPDFMKWVCSSEV